MAYSCDCRKKFTEAQVYRMKRFLSTCPLMNGFLVDNIEIGLDMTWDDTQAEDTSSCYPNIIIKEGIDFSLKTKLNFLPDAGILIQKGGKLTIEDAILSGCNEFWQGIEIEGDPTLSQFPTSNQGRLNFKNNSKIEYAQIGIHVNEGGLLFAENSILENNVIGIKFSSYPNFSNLGYVNNCTFDVNDEFYTFGLNNTPLFSSHGSLEMMKSAHFNGCNFSDQRTLSLDVPERGNGIESNHSGLFANTCSFDGFKVAISANEGFGPPISTYRISSSTFDNNLYGIYNFAVNDFRIEGNNIFNIGSYPDPNAALKHVGIFLESGTAFKIELNSFNGLGGDSPIETFGIVARNTGSEANDIAENTFHNLSIANQAEGLNRGPFGEGLEYLCNTNTGNNLIDFIVPTQSNIAEFQGNGLATKNTFSANQNHQYEDFFNEGGMPTIYYYLNAIGQVPDQNRILNIMPNEVTLTNSCPSDEGGGGGGGVIIDIPLDVDDKESIQQNFQNAENNYDSNLALLESLIDDGDSNALTNNIESSTGENANQIQQQLLNISPYVSVGALNSYLGRTDIFDQANMEQILVANPDALRKPDLYIQLPNLFSGGLSQTVWDALNTTTERTELEMNIASHRRSMFRNANLLIRDILIRDNLDLESLRQWWSNKKSLEADYLLALSWLWENDEITANEIFDAIPNTYELSDEQISGYNDFRTFTSLWHGFQQAGKSLTNLEENDLTTIINLANEGEGVANTIAKGLLNFAYGYNYYLEPQSLDLPTQALVQPSQNNSSFSLTHMEVIAFPNPAKDIVTFKYNLKDDITEAIFIRISDLNGKELEKIELIDTIGRVNWNTETLDDGIYLYQLENSGIKGEWSKIVLIK